MTESRRWNPTRTLMAYSMVMVLLFACGSDVDGPPVGDPLLPDLVPAPPVELSLKTEEDGKSTLRFTSTLINVGEGDFLLRSTRTNDQWLVEQNVLHDESGSQHHDLEATMTWGGDGHEHWHISRVANYWLEALDDDGKPIPEVLGRDTKVGFCFYDSLHSLPDLGPEEFAYSVHECGHEDDNLISMGLSPGWADVYTWTLPGQSFDITGLPDGVYRIWAEADVSEWFIESTRDNNLAWADFDLSTDDQGLRWALIVDSSPEPRAS